MKTNIYILSIIISLFTIQLNAQSNEKLIIKAKQLKKENKINEAMKIINQVLEQDSRDTEAIVLKTSLLFYHKKKYQDAYDFISKALKDQPNNPILLSQRGLILAQLSKFDLAKNDLKNAINGLKNVKDISIKCKSYKDIGTLAGYLRRNMESYEYLKKAMNCNPNNSEIYINLAATCFDINKTDEGIDYLMKASKIDPNNFMIYGNLGFAYQEKGNYKLAIDYFNKALKLKPNNPQTIGNIAYNQYKLGKLSIALKNINKSIELYPENSYSYRTRALIYLAMKKKKKACNDIETALDKHYTEYHGNAAQEFKNKNCK